jgi:hypothetical protein
MGNKSEAKNVIIDQIMVFMVSVMKVVHLYYNVEMVYLMVEKNVKKIENVW